MAIITSLNQLVKRKPQQVAKPSMLTSSNPWRSGNSDLRTLSQFQQVSTLWKGATVRAEVFAAIPWTLYRVNGRSRKRTPVDRHPALVMLEEPNDWQDGYDFRVAYLLTMDLLGKAYIYTPGAGDRMPISQYLLRPDAVTPKISEDGKEIVSYNYREPGGNNITYKSSEISLRRLTHPTDLLDGVGPVETLLAELGIARLSRQWQHNFYAKNAAPGGVYSFKEPLEPDEFDELAERIRHNTGEDIILDNDASYERVAFTMREMQFDVLREQSRDTILEALGVPKTFLGQANDVNRASAETLEHIFAKYELTPALTRYKSWLNNKVLPMFGDRNNYEFDYLNPVKEDTQGMATAITAVQTLVTMGADPQEAMEMFGLPNLEFTPPHQQPRYNSDQIGSAEDEKLGELV